MGRLVRRSAGDPTIIGREVYDIVSLRLIGIPQLATKDTVRGDWVVIVRVPGQDNPVHMHLHEVLVEKFPLLSLVEDEEPPTMELPPLDPNKLDQRTHRGIPVSSSPERAKKIRDATSDHREPGVAGDEDALPKETDPEPDPNDRPAGDLSDVPVTLYPAGKPKGRKTKREDNASKSGASLSQGGSTMVSVAEVKGLIDSAMRLADEATQLARSAIEKTEQAQQQLAIATESSQQDTVARAGANLGHSKQQFEEGIQAILAAKENAEQYAANL